MRPLVLHCHERPVTTVLFNRDGDLLFSAGKDGWLNVWYAETGNRLGTYPREGGSSTGVGAVIWDCDVTNDSSRIIAASGDQKILFYDTEYGTLVHTLSVDSPVKSVEWNRRPDRQDKFLHVNDSFAKVSKSIGVWASKGDGDKPERILTIDDFDGKCVMARWGPFDETIISAHENGSFNVWEVTSGELLHDIRAHKFSLNCMTFNTDRTLMLTCSTDGTAKLWETHTFKELKVYDTDRSLNACGISPLMENGQMASRKWHILLGGGQEAENVTTTAAGEGKFQVLLWNMIHGEEIGRIKCGFGPIHTLQWMHDGTGFATGGEEGIVRIYKFDEPYFTQKYF